MSEVYTSKQRYRIERVEDLMMGPRVLVYDEFDTGGMVYANLSATEFEQNYELVEEVMLQPEEPENDQNGSNPEPPNEDSQLEIPWEEEETPLPNDP